MATGQQHIRRAKKGRGNQNIGDKLGLPVCGFIQAIAHEHHLTDDDHGDDEQYCGDNAEETREPAGELNKDIHASDPSGV